GEISTTEAMRNFSHISKIDFLGDRRLAKVGLQDGLARLFIWERDINELVQPTRSEDCRINDVWTIGGTNNENIFLASHAIHLSEDLINDSVSGSTSISNTATSGFGNRI